MSDTVYIKQFWPAKPVYHAYDPDQRGKEADMTICGQVIYPAGGPTMMTGLPDRHAARFGRPCRRCFVVDDGRGGGAA